MASVFLSYDHDDSARAAPIAAAIEAYGHSVWWDRQIHGGAEYNNAIETAVEMCDAVVVLWSANSVRSAWVRDEAGEGRDRGKLVPVLLERVKPPMGFRQYQTVDLTRWNGGKRIPRLTEMLDAIDKVASSNAAAAAPASPPGPKQKRVTVTPDRRMSRRLVLGGGTAAAVTLAGGVWWSTRPREDPRAEALIARAEDQLRHEAVDAQTGRILEEAVAIQPRSAKAWGLLALVKSFLVQGAEPKQAQSLIEDAEKAARRALSLDSKEPNALLAMFELQGSTLDWITRDQKLRQIIAIAPGNLGAIVELESLTAATGLVWESWDWNERALALESLSSEFLGKRALKLWVFGRTSEADKVSDQLRALYPTDPWPWFVRVQIYAFTGRVGAAMGMLDSSAAIRPMANLWRASFPALDNPSSASVAKAREACVRAAQASGAATNEAMLIMSALGQLDTAFDIADASLLSRGPLAAREQSGSGQAADDASWRINTQWMWAPPVAAMRADPRFLPLCGSIGLADYWKKRGVKPDYLRTKR